MGGSSFSRCLIEINADNVLKESLTMGVPLIDGSGFTIETVNIEYEWKPSRCDLCKIFGHVYDHCTNKVSIPPIVDTPIVEKTNDGFQTVSKRRRRVNLICFVEESALKAVVPPTKEGNITMSNSYAALDESEEEIENMYDESANLLNTTKTGESSSTFIVVAVWFIWNNPLIMKKWNPDVNLFKEDVGNVLVWVKLHGVPVTSISKDGLSAIATKLDTLLMLDSYTSDMCIQSWGRSSYARALIEVRADVKMKDNIVVAMPKIFGEGFYTCTVRVEYEWKPPRCACCKGFSHVQDECPKNIDPDVAKNMKKPSQVPRVVLVCPKVGFKPVKQVYRQVSKKKNVNTSGNKKKDAKPTIEVSNSNPFDVLNLVENDGDLGTNGGISNLASKKAKSSGSSFWNVTLVDDEGKHLANVDSSGDHDSEDEVASVDNEITNFLASKKVGYGTNSLLKQWKENL
ncbi:reverse transcriptase domain-containing protein [Tanacetum coccineum]|uniref:Reverse transcriptase domain-containing protein n=1 Tax=Tanacetum coccineum TaxID=301880 RepID=A0ABQ5BFZ4_9ASTR